MAKGKRNVKAVLLACTTATAARVAAQVLLLGAVAAATAWGLPRLRQYVESKAAAPPGAARVVLKQRPHWMSDALAAQIVASAHVDEVRSAMDRSLLELVDRKLRANPWVKQVRQVRRGFGQAPGDTVEIDCEFRVPMALVSSFERGRNSAQEYFLVDGEAYRLPEKYPVGRLPRVMFDADGHVSLRIIEGVAAPPPAEGRRWSGEDLAAGLDLVKLLSGHAFTEPILRVDVSNFAHRQRPNAPQLALITRHNSRIEWGEPVRMTFHAELTPNEKLQRLARLYDSASGRIDLGRSWLDIRNDQILVRAEESPELGAGLRRAGVNN